MYLSEHYPHLVELMPIGKTSEGRPLKVVKISSGQTRENDIKPAIWIDAGNELIIIVKSLRIKIEIDNISYI